MVQYYAAAPYPNSPGSGANSGGVNGGRPLIRSENGLGVAGFIISLLGLITCGVLSPVGLLLSMVGLMRRPRGFAIAGAVLGLIGSALIGGFVTMVVLAAREASVAVERARNEAVTRAAIASAEVDVQNKIVESGALPEGIEGNKVVIHHSDAWGNSLRYDRRQDAFSVRSAGPDGEFETGDDLTSSGGGYNHIVPPVEVSPEPAIPLE